MKNLIFDSSSIISLSMNGLLWILDPLRKKFDGEFLISESVKDEIIDKPLTSKKYKLEALNLLEITQKGILKTFKENMKMSEELLELTNSIFRGKHENIKILHEGEITTLAKAIESGTEAFVIDERTTRLLIENPNKLHSLLEKKLHTPINVDKNKLKKFKEMTKGIKILRSTELVIISYEMGLFKNYFNIKGISNLKHEILDGLLWALKLRGCSISDAEINEIIKIEK